MIAGLFKDKVQLALFSGIAVSGLSLVVGIYTPYIKWLGFAAVLGPVLATITVIIYGINLIKAIFLDDAYSFWSGLCTLNLGLLLVQFVIFESQQLDGFLSILLSASTIGLVLSWALYKFGGINSRLIVLIFHVLFLILGSLSAELVMPLTVAVVLILMPLIIHSIPTAGSSRGKTNESIA
jgi:hypothetical protein